MTTPVNDNTPLPDRWAEAFTDREHEHIEFCRRYEKGFTQEAHNHLSMVIIARLAYMLERSYEENDLVVSRVNEALDGLGVPKF